MGEGMNVEVAEHLTHPHASGHHDRAHELLEVIEVVMLAVVAIATAWTGFQAAKWDGHQSILYGEASRDRFQADAASTLGGQKLVGDSGLLNGWLQAHATNDTELQQIFVNRFTPEYRVAFDAWIAEDPFTNPKAPPGPGYMPEYHNPDMQEAERLNVEASRKFDEGTDAARDGGEVRPRHGPVRIRVVPGRARGTPQGAAKPDCAQHRRGRHAGVRDRLGHRTPPGALIPDLLMTNDDHSPLAGTEVHYLRSSHVGDEFKIFVGHCGIPDGARPSVLYLTDANGFFGATVDLVRSMQLAQHLPPLLVVGIGYRAGGLGDTVAIRTARSHADGRPGVRGALPRARRDGRRGTTPRVRARPS